MMDRRRALMSADNGGEENMITGDFGTAWMETITVDEAFSGNMITAPEKLVSKLSDSAGNKCFLIKRKNSASPTPVNNELGAARTYIGSTAFPTTAGTRYRSGWVNVQIATNYDAVLAVGAVYEVICFTLN